MNKNGIISKLILLIYRLGNRIYYKIKTPIIRQILWILYRSLDILIVQIIGGSDFPAQAQIGSKLYLPHNGKGVIIHPNAVIGNDVTIYHQVTIGSNKTGNNGAPKIGNNVFIGAGAKVLGRLCIDDNAQVGSNAVVLIDVPANATAVGIPAKIKQVKVN
ncbi:serine acetyltransferase [Clostridium sp. CM027]|uniref:serine O-acetyltransferase n=1 Tax=Clostridium sp. CM027 TaxID=2849865 RepID=UPI001C6DFE70|nr:serine acetyltransferase [Clostridium sp. CM027]MBW9145269.1 serine acetyltransferase [Clostridium sp. CM027]UVE40398.1 serine acetyltransferase [Clostridium sp. CM027]